ncbi:MAG: hypothetical protein GYA17_21850 [Chloroflexi bacterium]|nr:hypothetical protein [Chloroflexota bacterium]
MIHQPFPLRILPQLLILVAAALLYWQIDHYYNRVFGRVLQVPRGHLDWLLYLAGGALGLAAFFAEATFPHLPFSPLGLVLASSLLVDYLMLANVTQVRYMPLWPAFGLLIAFCSVLPLLGLDSWWKTIGAQTQLIGMLRAAGLIMAAAGIASHLYFVHMLPGSAQHGRSV